MALRDQWLVPSQDLTARIQESACRQRWRHLPHRSGQGEKPLGSTPAVGTPVQRLVCSHVLSQLCWPPGGGRTTSYLPGWPNPWSALCTSPLTTCWCLRATQAIFP